MISGNGSISLRKAELENQKIPAIGFTKLYFAHKASAGATGINLASLTAPTEMTANGFVQPTTAQLTAAQLLFFKRNLRLESSARGILIQGLSYVVASSTQINFIGFTALEGEIFTGTLDYNAQTGLKVVDATAQPATGTLAATTADFNLGTPYQTNKYSSTRLGAVLVYRDRFLQSRNTGNSSVVLDGDYYELDNGSGYFSVIRFNISDADNASEIRVVPNGLLSERPDGSMMAVIESVNGYVQNMATYVATLASQSVATILGAAPTNVDLKAFGDTVVLKSLPNVWTSSQAFPGVTDGSNASTGNIGEYFVARQTTATNFPATTTYGDAVSIALTAGDWDVSLVVDCIANGATVTSVGAGISATTGNSSTGLQAGDNFLQSIVPTVATDSNIVVPAFRVSISAGATYYAKVTATFSLGNPQYKCRLSARRIR